MERRQEKINFQLELEKLIENEVKDNKPGLLLHSCCGPCSSYVLSYLKNYFDITLVYYNPNIYPESEYELRLSEQLKLIELMNQEDAEADIKFLKTDYIHSEFLEAAKGYESAPEGGARCTKCFELRLQKTAELALEHGFKYFGTTLTVSPHKNAVLLNRIGNDIQEQIAEEDKVILWLPSDFKKKEGYKKSIELSKKYDLYRQNYCGCEFSIWE